MREVVVSDFHTFRNSETEPLKWKTLTLGKENESLFPSSPILTTFRQILLPPQSTPEAVLHFYAITYSYIHYLCIFPFRLNFAFNFSCSV